MFGKLYGISGFVMQMESQVLILEFLGNVISILAAWEYQMNMKTIAFNPVIFCFECFYLTLKAAIMLQ
jgi:hypothetical protein